MCKTNPQRKINQCCTHHFLPIKKRGYLKKCIWDFKRQVLLNYIQKLDIHCLATSEQLYGETGPENELSFLVVQVTV